jgi:cytochrome o ubiquinol oxidase subunit 2
MRYLALAVLLFCPAVLGGCSGGVLDPKGPVAAAERLILLNSLGIMLAIVIPTILATLGVAFWFRASNGRARYLPDFNYSGRLEMLVWSIPIMTVLLVGGVAWVGSYDLDPPKAIASAAKPVGVQVASLDWKWLFIYPDHGIATVNQLIVPVGTPISFELTSSGVMNSFFVPQLGGQIYTMAGMVTRLHLQADHVGTYRGMSANYSGAGFSDMVFNVDAVPAERFAQWVAATRTTGPVLDAQSYADLAKSSQAVAPFSFQAVAPNLFKGIVSGGMQTADPSQHTHHRGQKNESPRQAQLGRNPVPRADHHGHGVRGSLGHRVRSWVGHSEGLRALPMARLAHVCGPQAHRRHVSRAGASHAATRLC